MCSVPLGNFAMSDLREQRAAVKFCVKLGHNFTETHEMIQKAYGEKAVSHTHCSAWFNHYKNRESMKDSSTEDSPGSSSTSTDTSHIAQVIQSTIKSNPYFTVCEIAEKVGISVDLCQEILTEKLGTLQSTRRC